MYADDGGVYDPTKDRTESYVLTIPTDGVPSSSGQILNNVTNLFCAGHTHLPDGRVLVIGGQKEEYYKGVATTTIFNWQGSYSWDTPAGGAMREARWYPTAARMANGDIVAIGGTITQGVANKIPEVWSGGKWRALTTASQQAPSYPWIFQDPKNANRVFMAGPTGSVRYLDTVGTGKWSLGPARKVADRTRGTAVMYDIGKALLVGGKGGNTSTETINLLAASPAWTSGKPMQFGRIYHHATVLFDGKVVVTGGQNPGGSVFAAELWDPATGTWKTMAAAKTPRLYHSVGFLLPDGRVVSAGGGRSPQPDHKDLEIFSPPYLFIAGERPTIASVPGSVTYGQKFSLVTSDAANIGKVSLVGLPSVTHTFNSGQRFLPLNFTAGSGALSVTAPTSRLTAPPGHYMVSIVNKAGKPSVAKIIQVL
jgi:hypothetical protein